MTAKYSPALMGDHEETNRMLVISNPISKEVVGLVPRCEPAEVIDAVERARAAQPAWQATPFRERARIIKRFHDLILKQKDDLFDTIQQESGKSRRDAFVELFAVASEARYYAYHGERFLRAHRAGFAIPLRDSARVVYHPLGVVGVISPWNFPFILSVGDTIPALLAGNAVVIKPASLTPMTAIWGQQKLIECGLPENVLQVVTGAGSKIGNALIDHVDFVMFTGSTNVGRKVAERAARRLIPYSMELGGKNPVLVLPDANLRHAAAGVIEGCFNNNGQVCINYERVYVDQSIYEPFIEELLVQLKKVRLGCDTTFDTDLGTLISPEQLETVETHVQDAVSKGARVLAGGETCPEKGPYFYEPTLLADVTPEMLVYHEETFGPVASIYKAESLEEAIDQANTSDYGLQAGVFTRNRRRGRQIAAQIEAGTVSINDTYTSWGAMGAPMGGFKQSGIGRRHGPMGIRKYTEPQTIFTNHTNSQISSMETALSINKRLANLLVFGLRIWRHIPFIR